MTWNNMEMTRRSLLKRSLIAGAGVISSSVPKPSRADAIHEDRMQADTGISEMRLRSTRIDALAEFYADKLGLVVSMNDDVLTVQAGTTRITFEPAEETDPEPFYHFAFNIPENKLESARGWQKKRTPLIRRGNREVINFSNWNAHSIFFNDPAGNIVEYIARHDLKNASTGHFTPKDLLYASEIGIVVDDVTKTVAAAKQSLGLGVYRGSFKHFAPVGDEHALLIVVKRNRLWTPDKKRRATVHPVRATIRGRRDGLLRQDDYEVDMETTGTTP